MARQSLCIASLGAALIATACAQAPESVAPAYVNEAQYHGQTCRQLANEEARVRRALAALYAEQSQSRADDVVGYLISLRPLASMAGGDLRHQIALYKGEHAAIERIMTRSCPIVRF
jgi:hypothetical protein